jgi:hypothetical protein
MSRPSSSSRPSTAVARRSASTSLAPRPPPHPTPPVAATTTITASSISSVPVPSLSSSTSTPGHHASSLSLSSSSISMFDSGLTLAAPSLRPSSARPPRRRPSSGRTGARIIPISSSQSSTPPAGASASSIDEQKDVYEQLKENHEAQARQLSDLEQALAAVDGDLEERDKRYETLLNKKNESLQGVHESRVLLPSHHRNRQSGHGHHQPPGATTSERSLLLADVNEWLVSRSYDAFADEQHLVKRSELQSSEYKAVAISDAAVNSIIEGVRVPESTRLELMAKLRLTTAMANQHNADTFQSLVTQLGRTRHELAELKRDHRTMMNRIAMIDERERRADDRVRLLESELREKDFILGERNHELEMTRKTLDTINTELKHAHSKMDDDRIDIETMTRNLATRELLNNSLREAKSNLEKTLHETKASNQSLQHANTSMELELQRERTASEQLRYNMFQKLQQAEADRHAAEVVAANATATSTTMVASSHHHTPQRRHSTANRMSPSPSRPSSRHHSPHPSISSIPSSWSMPHHIPVLSLADSTSSVHSTPTIVLPSSSPTLAKAGSSTASTSSLIPTSPSTDPTALAILNDISDNVSERSVSTTASTSAPLGKTPSPALSSSSSSSRVRPTSAKMATPQKGNGKRPSKKRPASATSPTSSSSTSSAPTIAPSNTASSDASTSTMHPSSSVRRPDSAVSKRTPVTSSVTATMMASTAMIADVPAASNNVSLSSSTTKTDSEPQSIDELRHRIATDKSNRIERKWTEYEREVCNKYLHHAEITAVLPLANDDDKTIKTRHIGIQVGLPPTFARGIPNWYMIQLASDNPSMDTRVVPSSDDTLIRTIDTEMFYSIADLPLPAPRIRHRSTSPSILPSLASSIDPTTGEPIGSRSSSETPTNGNVNDENDDQVEDDDDGNVSPSSKSKKNGHKRSQSTTGRKKKGKRGNRPSSGQPNKSSTSSSNATTDTSTTGTAQAKTERLHGRRLSTQGSSGGSGYSAHTISSSRSRRGSVADAMDPISSAAAALAWSTSLASATSSTPSSAASSRPSSAHFKRTRSLSTSSTISNQRRGSTDLLTVPSSTMATMTEEGTEGGGAGSASVAMPIARQRARRPSAVEHATVSSTLTSPSLIMRRLEQGIIGSGSGSSGTNTPSSTPMSPNQPILSIAITDADASIIASSPPTGQLVASPNPSKPPLAQTFATALMVQPTPVIAHVATLVENNTLMTIPPTVNHNGGAAETTISNDSISASLDTISLSPSILVTAATSSTAITARPLASTTTIAVTVAATKKTNALMTLTGRLLSYVPSSAPMLSSSSSTALATSASSSTSTALVPVTMTTPTSVGVPYPQMGSALIAAREHVVAVDRSLSLLSIEDDHQRANERNWMIDLANGHGRSLREQQIIDEWQRTKHNKNVGDDNNNSNDSGTNLPKKDWTGLMVRGQTPSTNVNDVVGDHAISSVGGSMSRINPFAKVPYFSRLARHTQPPLVSYSEYATNATASNGGGNGSTQPDLLLRMLGERRLALWDKRKRRSRLSATAATKTITTATSPSRVRISDDVKNSDDDDDGPEDNDAHENAQRIEHMRHRLMKEEKKLHHQDIHDDNGTFDYNDNDGHEHEYDHGAILSYDIDEEQRQLAWGLAGVADPLHVSHPQRATRTTAATATATTSVPVRVRARSVGITQTVSASSSSVSTRPLRSNDNDRRANNRINRPWSASRTASQISAATVASSSSNARTGLERVNVSGRQVGFEIR